MKKILSIMLLLFVISAFGGAKPEKPAYGVILTSCGTTHVYPADLSKEKLATLVEAHEKNDCGAE